MVGRRDGGKMRRWEDVTARRCDGGKICGKMGRWEDVTVRRRH
jgi:hypothetical protein